MPRATATSQLLSCPEKLPKVAKAAKSRLMASLLHKTGLWTFYTQGERRIFLTNETYFMMCVRPQKIIRRPYFVCGKTKSIMLSRRF